MNKRLIAALLAVAAAMSLTGCGEDKKHPDKKDPAHSRSADGIATDEENSGALGIFGFGDDDPVKTVETDILSFTFDSDKWDINEDYDSVIFQLEYKMPKDHESDSDENSENGEDDPLPEDSDVYIPIIGTHNPDAAEVDLKSLATGLEEGFEEAVIEEEEYTQLNGFEAYRFKTRNVNDEGVESAMVLYVVRKGEYMITTGAVAFPSENMDRFDGEIQEILQSITFSYEEEENNDLELEGE